MRHLKNTLEPEWIEQSEFKLSWGVWRGMQAVPNDVRGRVPERFGFKILGIWHMFFESIIFGKLELIYLVTYLNEW